MNDIEMTNKNEIIPITENKICIITWTLFFFLYQCELLEWMVWSYLLEVFYLLEVGLSFRYL